MERRELLYTSETQHLSSWQVLLAGSPAQTECFILPQTDLSKHSNYTHNPFDSDYQTHNRELVPWQVARIVVNSAHLLGIQASRIHHDRTIVVILVDDKKAFSRSVMAPLTGPGAYGPHFPFHNSCS